MPSNDAATKNVNGGSGEGAWCTPKWIADLLGPFDIDPCSNQRSHIGARFVCSLETGGNGLLEDDGDGVFGPGCFNGLDRGELETNWAGPAMQSFINPPYNRGEVIRWVRHYRHTRFTFLLKWAPDTKWFGELIGHCTHVWFPVGQRIEFEPPPNVKTSSNPFPHALYLRDPPADRLDRLRKSGLTFEVDAAFIENLRALGVDIPGGPTDLRRDSTCGGGSRAV